MKQEGAVFAHLMNKLRLSRSVVWKGQKENIPQRVVGLVFQTIFRAVELLLKLYLHLMQSYSAAYCTYHLIFWVSATLRVKHFEENCCSKINVPVCDLCGRRKLATNVLKFERERGIFGCSSTFICIRCCRAKIRDIELSEQLLLPRISSSWSDNVFPC